MRWPVFLLLVTALLALLARLSVSLLALAVPALLTMTGWSGALWSGALLPGALVSGRGRGRRRRGRRGMLLLPVARLLAVSTLRLAVPALLLRWPLAGRCGRVRRGVLMRLLPLGVGLMVIRFALL